MALTLFVACGVVALLSVSYRGLQGLRKLALQAPLGACALQASERSPANVAELNEMTIDLQARLRDPAFVPRSCARASLASGTLVALIQVARCLGQEGLGQEQASGFAAPLIAFSCGGAGMIGCSLIGRWADEEARGLRARWNALIRRSIRDVAI